MAKTDDQAKYSDAKAAYEAFRRMCPQLSAYARSITGKAVRVQPGAGSMTDGKTIWIRPPLSLARPLKHDRGLCEVYDSNNHSQCPACASRESLMSVVHHEINHIAFGSFEKIAYDQIRTQVVPAAKMELGRDIADEMLTLMGMGNDAPASMIALVNKLKDEHLKTIELFAEDLRINEQGYKRRPGLRKLAYAEEKKILDLGIEAENEGEYTHWADQPVDMQILGCVLFGATGQQLHGSFVTEAIDVFEDEQVNRIATALPHCRNVYDTTVQAIALLARIRELGYMTVIEDEETEDDKGEASDSGEGQGEEGGEQGSDVGDSDEPGTPSRVSAKQSELTQLLEQLLGHAEQVGCSGTDEGGELQPVENFTPQQERDLTKVIEAAWVLDRVPVNIEGVQVFGRGEGEAYSAYGRYNTFQENEGAPESVIGRAVMQARIAFGNNARVEHHRNQRSGKLATNVLGKRAHLGDDRLFGKKIMPDKRNYHVMLGLDVSYSMANGNIIHLKRTARALADVCDRVGVGFSVYAHSSVDAALGRYVGIWPIKEADDKWNKQSKQHLANLGPVSGNLDGHSIMYYRKKLESIQATDKVLMYFTDGSMPAENYAEELQVLQSEIEVCRRKRITLLGVGIKTSSPKAHGLDTVRVDTPEDYAAVVKHLQKILVHA